MANKTIWKAMALTVNGEGSTTMENGIRTYTPPKAEWSVLKTDTNFEKLEAWLTAYINRNGYCCSDFKISR